jgi:hypothetical protein
VETFQKIEGHSIITALQATLMLDDFIEDTAVGVVTGNQSLKNESLIEHDG